MVVLSDWYMELNGALLIFFTENQLRKVEKEYLAQCSNQEQDALLSIEERMIRYQKDYDALCEKRMQEEVS